MELYDFNDYNVIRHAKFQPSLHASTLHENVFFYIEINKTKTI